MKRYAAVAIALLVLAGLAAAAAKLVPEKASSGAENHPGYKHESVVISGKPFDAYVSDTESLRESGLGGFSGLPQGKAMLFVFQEEGSWGFWMKDMLFPIDMVWVSRDMRIVSFEKNVAPETYPATFFPKALSLYVIELPAGTVEAIGAKEGDPVSFGGAR